MKAKIEDREKAIALRLKGKSVNEITRVLKVAKSSVSNWVRHVKLTDQQRAILDARRTAMGQQTCESNSKRLWETSLKVRENYQAIGKEDARKKNVLHMQACMLYWAEGEKSRNLVAIANTDPYIIRIFVECLKDFFNVSTGDIRLSIRAYSDNGLNVQKIQQFWTKLLELPLENIISIKFDVDKRIRTGKRKKKHPYGICKVTVSSTEIVQRIFGAVQEYGKFENISWVA